MFHIASAFLLPRQPFRRLSKAHSARPFWGDLYGSRSVALAGYLDGDVEKVSGHHEVRLQVPGDARGGENGWTFRQGQVEDQLVREVRIDGHPGFVVGQEFDGSLLADGLGGFPPGSEGGESGNRMLVLSPDEDEGPLMKMKVP
jgi:hypothetical protein